MTRMFVLLAIAALSACDRSAAPANIAMPDSTATPVVTPATETVPTPAGPFTNRAWVRAAQIGPPGGMHIFLSDGTLVSDSCWETYRLSRWHTDGDGRLLWQEDGIDIRAEVLSVDDDELVLQMEFSSGSEQHRFVAATVPYVCPDMPR